MNDLLSIHLALYSENEPHEQVIQLVADQLQLVDQEVSLLGRQAAFEARAILEHATTRLEVWHFDLAELGD